MIRGRAIALLVLLASTALGASAARYVVARDYAYGGGSLGDLPDYRAITWVWRSAADREVCRRSIFSEAGAQRLRTSACERARLAPVRHRSRVDVVEPDPACGALTTIAFTPAGQDRLTRLTGCIAPEQLAAGPERLEPGDWVFAVDVHELAETSGPQLQRIGDYRTWSDCERIRLAVRDDLAKERDAEAVDGAKLASAGACVPQELLE
jgi:hypothetical protein